MQNIIIVIHLIIVVALVGVVLVQRSEGGGLGIGGGSGLMTARGATNVLTRSTAILAAAFFATSLILSIIARYSDRPADIFDRIPQQEQGQDGTGVNRSILDQLGPATPSTPVVPSTDAAPVAPSEAEAAPAMEAPATEAPVTEAPASAEPQAPTGQ